MIDVKIKFSAVGGDIPEGSQQSPQSGESEQEQGERHPLE